MSNSTKNLIQKPTKLLRFYRPANSQGHLSMHFSLLKKKVSNLKCYYQDSFPTLHLI